MADISASELAGRCDQLLERGYTIIPCAAPGALIETLKEEVDELIDHAPLCAGEFYGNRTKRVGGLLKKARSISELVLHPIMIALAERILGPHCDSLQLSLTQAISVEPGEIAQAPHRDQSMWWRLQPETEYQLGVIWPLTPFTKETGATRIWPGTRAWDGHANVAEGDAIVAEAEPGTAIVFTGSVVHGAGGNVSDTRRVAIMIAYCLGWLKPFENQWLVYPPEVARSFAPELAELVGYKIQRPNLGNYEGDCPSRLLRTSAGRAGFVDAV